MVRKNINLRVGTDLWINVLNEDGTHKTSINIDNRTQTVIYYINGIKIESVYPTEA